MTKSWIITLALTCLTAWAAADDVKVKGLLYNNAKVMSFVNGEVTFELASGSSVTKGLDEVDLIKLTGHDSFNDAEEKLSKEKYVDAVKAYDQAMDRAGEGDWLKSLIVARRLRALGQTPQIDRSTKEWLAMMEETQASKMAIALRPKKVGLKTSQANIDAAKLLEQAIAKGGKPEPVATMRKLLLDIYTAMGKTEEAARLAKELTGGGEAASADGEGDKDAPATSGGSLSDQVAAAEFQLASDPQAALDVVQRNLKKFTPGELPRALMVAGKAQMKLSEKAAEADKKKFKLAAGLNFMRVAAFYPTTTFAAEALFNSATLTLEMGNRQGAKLAFQQVVDVYKDSPFAAKAQEQITALGGPAASTEAATEASND